MECATSFNMTLTGSFALPLSFSLPEEAVPEVDWSASGLLEEQAASIVSIMAETKSTANKRFFIMTSLKISGYCSKKHYLTVYYIHGERYGEKGKRVMI